MDLAPLGWDDERARQFAAAASDDASLAPARVCRVDRTVCRVLAAAGEFEAVVTSRRGEEADAASPPSVGDWCAFRAPEQGGPGVLHRILPRRTFFARKAAGRTAREQAVAANVDLAFLVTGLDGDFSLRRIERLLALTWESGARPVVVLNKADACDCVEARVAEATAVAPGAEVVATSAVAGGGLDVLRARIPAGATVVFLGSSGVGKSTLINRLLGVDRLATGAVRADDGRGRHTTTRRELLLLPGGGVVIDSPGVREVGVFASEDAIDATFAEIADLARSCRFNDCTHSEEPGCAVRAAVERGEIEPDRLASFHALRREAASAARRAEQHLQRAHEKRLIGKWSHWAKHKRDINL